MDGFLRMLLLSVKRKSAVKRCCFHATGVLLLLCSYTRLFSPALSSSRPPPSFWITSLPPLKPELMACSPQEAILTSINNSFSVTANIFLFCGMDAKLERKLD
jgi:hypothetical protein